MNYFSNSIPNLITNKTIKNMEKLIKVENPIIKTSFKDNFNIFYEKYIEPNIFVFIIIGILILFLTFKYYTKGEFNKIKINKSLDELLLEDNLNNDTVNQDFTLSENDFNNINNYTENINNL